MDDALKAAGLESEDDRMVFSHIAKKTPGTTADGAAIPFADQIAHAVAETNKYKEAQRTRLIQEIDQPLDRGGAGLSGPPAPASPAAETVSLDDALNDADTFRTL